MQELYCEGLPTGRYISDVFAGAAVKFIMDCCAKLTIDLWCEYKNTHLFHGCVY